MILRNSGLKRIIKVFIIIVTLVTAYGSSISTISSPNLSTSETKAFEITDGDYLVYEVVVREFVTNNLSMVSVNAADIYDEPGFLSAKLRVEFHKYDNQGTETTVTLSFSMQGEGFLYYNQENNGIITFDYNYDLTLIRDEASNKFHLQNDTEWGYLPFIIQPGNKNNIYLSGSTKYSNELVLGKKSGDTIIESPKGMQECYIVDSTNNITAFGFINNLKLIPTYFFDSDTNVLLKSSINDPFWTIFNRSFVLFEGYMVLSETNLDLGSASLTVYLYFLLNIASIFFIPIIFIISALTMFFIHKYKKRQKRKKRMIAKQKRFRLKNR